MMKHPVICSICHSKLTHSLRVIGATKEISFLVDPCPKLLSGEPHERVDSPDSSASSVEREVEPKKLIKDISTAPQALIAAIKGGYFGSTGDSKDEPLLISERDDDRALLQEEPESGGDSDNT